jgi:hypothetical protein
MVDTRAAFSARRSRVRGMELNGQGDFGDIEMDQHPDHDDDWRATAEPRDDDTDRHPVGRMVIDSDHDGDIDRMLIDTDGDGDFDRVLIDTDGDGDFDIARDYGDDRPAGPGGGGPIRY